jgi:hypothetical protein
MKRRKLGGERAHTGLLLLQLQVLGGGLELDEHLAALHLLAEDQVGRHHPAGDRCLDGVGGLAHLQARGLADRIQRHLGAEEPGSPGAEEPDDEEYSQGRAPGAISFKSALCGNKHGGFASHLEGISWLSLPTRKSVDIETRAQMVDVSGIGGYLSRVRRRALGTQSRCMRQAE